MTKLLVVDDNEQNRYMAEVLLRGNGYEVESAVNGREALEKARKNYPSLIIADILMPVMDGFALCREWKLDDQLKSIPFIFYTATYTDPEDEKFALSLGADRFIVKPVEPEYLVTAIREVLDQFQANYPTLPVGGNSVEDVYLRQYNQVLIHKLEDKLAQLEVANQALQDEIRERKRAEEKLYRLERQLVQSQKMEAIGTLAGGIAHDFNNILLAIMGYAEIAFMDTREGKSVEKHLEQTLKASNRAKELVDQILTFSRQNEIDRQPVQIKPIVKEVLKLLRSSLPATIQIRQNLASKSLILANPTQIYQVMMNLCTNAAHAMKDGGGTIEVTLTDVEPDESFMSLQDNVASGFYQKLEVRDNGLGMTPDQLVHIFQPYYTTKKKGEGTGLGLSVVHGIVKNSGGEITVQSERNKGSQFKLFFPVVVSEAVADAPTAELPEGGREHVIFIDDELPLIEIGAMMLEKLGYQVSAFRDAKAALNVFKARPDDFDLVITDMTMPGLTGNQLIRELLQIRPGLPVILCTGFSAELTEEKASQLGVKAFLMKPFVFRDLAATIRHVLDNRRV
jgi:signal transduction histidine kinase